MEGRLEAGTVETVSAETTEEEFDFGKYVEEWSRLYSLKYDLAEALREEFLFLGDEDRYSTVLALRQSMRDSGWLEQDFEEVLFIHRTLPALK